MTEPFKNAFNHSLIENMAVNFARHDNNFNQTNFISQATEHLATLELKERSNQILSAMQQTLPKQLADAFKVILLSLAPPKSETSDVLFSQDFNKINTLGIDGWAIMPIADYIGIETVKAIQQSPKQEKKLILQAMQLFKQVTKRFSAEFGIRHLLLNYPNNTLNELTLWLTDPCQHVRRLISEGTRPRLPWGLQLTNFVSDPAPLLPLLNALKDDTEEYVRRSVANNLNDIAKDHDTIVNSTIKQWLPAPNKNRDRLIRHACRTLIKQGNTTTLTLLGYRPPKLNNVELSLSTKELILGQAINLNLTMASAIDEKQHLIVDYIVHHQKANGKTAGKVFKWKTFALNASSNLSITKKHTIKPITTRVYYAGMHEIEVVINGVSVAKQPFMLHLTKQ